MRGEMETQTQNAAVPVSLTKGIDVAGIERELAAMWQRASGEGSAGESGVVRACALNLIIYTTPQDNRDQLGEMLEIVNEHHPGRTLLLFSDREAREARLEAYVSTRCRLLGSSRQQICGEQVTIEAAGAVVARVASAIAPLLVADVPVFLWWKDIPHDEDELFDRMSRMADRVVIDSASFDHPYADLIRLDEVVKALSREARISDLNWGRLTSWRTLLASFWDVSDYRMHLERVERVVIAYDPPDAAPDEIAPKALLLAGWLASRLGWQFEAGGRDEGKARFTFRKAEQSIFVEMQAMTDEQGCDGMLSSVTLFEAAGGASFSVTLSRDGKRLETKADLGGAQSIGRLLAYEQKSEGQRLSRELGLMARDRVYEEALAVAARLTKAVK